jgi:hypothetical protein
MKVLFLQLIYLFPQLSRENDATIWEIREDATKLTELLPSPLTGSGASIPPELQSRADRFKSCVFNSAHLQMLY